MDAELRAFFELMFTRFDSIDRWLDAIEGGLQRIDDGFEQRETQRARSPRINSPEFVL